MNKKVFKCFNCGKVWEVEGYLTACPDCGSLNLAEGVFESESTFLDRLGEFKLLVAILSDNRFVVRKMRREPTALLSLN